MHHAFLLRAMRLALRGVVVLTLMSAIACGDARSFPKTYPITGRILVNGQPAQDCQIFLHRTSDENTSLPSTPQAVTNQKGEFHITSFHTNDGAPEGEYVVTIEWRERSGLMKKDFDGPDQLGGTYAKTEKTKGLKGFVVQVGKQPMELPPFQLEQSGDAKRKAEEGKKQRSFRGPLQ
jgi:hypothetical protein